MPKKSNPPKTPTLLSLQEITSKRMRALRVLCAAANGRGGVSEEEIAEAKQTLHDLREKGWES